MLSRLWPCFYPEDTKSITSLSIVRHPAEDVEDSKKGKKKEKGKDASSSPQTNQSALEEDYGWVRNRLTFLVAYMRLCQNVGPSVRGNNLAILGILS